MERPGAPRPTISLPKRGPKQAGSGIGGPPPPRQDVRSEEGCEDESERKMAVDGDEEELKGAEAVEGWYNALGLPKPFTAPRRLSEGVWRPDLRLVQLTTNKCAFIYLSIYLFIYLFI